MRSSRALFFILALILSWTSHAGSYQLKPVLIQLYYNEQPDSAGFNLVDALPDFCYRHIMAGDLNLYDSPAKKIKISGDMLKQIEQTNHSSAALLKTLFIHEYWTLKKNQLSFFHMGITLSDYKKDGTVISYGYVDLKEAYELLSNEYIKTNANGPWQLTYWEAITGRRYAWRLIQFGKRSFHDRQESQEWKDYALSKGWKSDLVASVPEIRKVEYNIDLKKPANAQLWKQTLKVFSGHPEVMDSCNKQFPLLQGKDTVVRLWVTEIWSRRDGFFEYRPLTMAVWKDQAIKCHLRWSDFSFTDFSLLQNEITSKQFEFEIVAINDQPVRAADASKYLEAIRSGEIPWTQLSNFVKNTKH
jgi:hypothetical protein